MDVITDYELKKYCHSVEQMLFYSTVVSGQKNSIQNTKCKKEYVKPKVVNGDMGRRTKMITEYRQTGRDVNGDNTVGIGWGWVQNILPCHPLSLIYHGLRSHSQGRTEPPGCLVLARWAGWYGVQVGRHVKC